MRYAVSRFRHLPILFDPDRCTHDRVQQQALILFILLHGVHKLPGFFFGHLLRIPELLRILWFSLLVHLVLLLILILLILILLVLVLLVLLLLILILLILVLLILVLLVLVLLVLILLVLILLVLVLLVLLLFKKILQAL